MTRFGHALECVIWYTIGSNPIYSLFSPPPTNTCAGFLGDANALYERFTAAVGAEGKAGFASLLDTPLTHFLRFLLATLERDARPLFEVLADKYRPAVARDSSFGGYVATIGARFYHIQPPQSGMQSMLANMMGGGMMGGGGGGRAALPSSAGSGVGKR